ncbi:MAG: hypothetical protein RRZ65_01725 [Tannerellaceae bacterium]
MVKSKCKVKKPNTDISIEKRALGELSIDYPVFCFRYFQKECLKSCSESQVKDFFDRLQRLGELGWNTINAGKRHDYGWEMLPVKQIKKTLPPLITPDIPKLMVFRYNNANYPFIAHRNGNILHVLFIEANFGDVYDHKTK